MDESHTHVAPSAFLGPLDIRRTAARRWITLAPLPYWSDVYGGLLTVAARFVTDLASVPRLPFVFLLTGDRAHGPAVIHDWLYQHPDWEDRALADAIFYEAMGVDQPELGFEAESLWARVMIWTGVRAGGWLAWRRYRNRGAVLNPVWTAGTWPTQLGGPGASLEGPKA